MSILDSGVCKVLEEMRRVPSAVLRIPSGMGTRVGSTLWCGNGCLSKDAQARLGMAGRAVGKFSSMRLVSVSGGEALLGNTAALASPPERRRMPVVIENFGFMSDG